MALRCNYCPYTLCFTGSHEKCSKAHNEWNDKCPYYRVFVSENPDNGTSYSSTIGLARSSTDIHEASYEERFTPGLLRGYVAFVDSTIRETERLHIDLRPEEKLRIAAYDDEIGIDVIELPALNSEEDLEMIRLIKDVGLVRAKLMFCTRLNVKEIESSLKYDPDWIGISVDFPNEHVNDAVLIQACSELVSHVHRHGVKASLYLENSTMVEMHRLEPIIRGLYADKFRDCDVASTLLPEAAIYRLRHLTNLVPKLFEVHYHNGKGLAVANSISAVAGGASSISATWNGMWENVEDTPMEEILFNLQELHGYDRFDLAKATEACEFIMKTSKRRVAPEAPESC